MLSPPPWLPPGPVCTLLPGCKLDLGRLVLLCTFALFCFFAWAAAGGLSVWLGFASRRDRCAQTETWMRAAEGRRASIWVPPHPCFASPVADQKTRRQEKNVARVHPRQIQHSSARRRDRRRLLHVRRHAAAVRVRCVLGERSAALGLSRTGSSQAALHPNPRAHHACSTFTLYFLPVSPMLDRTDSWLMSVSLMASRTWSGRPRGEH